VELERNKAEKKVDRVEKDDKKERKEGDKTRY
jgi:hypothetical protein